MPSGDGLILRFALPPAGIHATQVRALQRLACDHGSGLIEITRRGKLQLRGVQERGLLSLQRELQRLGLAADSALVVNPLAGLLRDYPALDALAAAISGALAASGAQDSLSGKFGVVLDCGGMLRDIAADVRVEVNDPLGELATVAVPAAEGGAWLELGTCRAEACPQAVAELALELAELTRSSRMALSRMRDLVRTRGHASLESRFAPHACSARRAPEGASPQSWIGFHVGRQSWFGVGAPFGVAEAASWLTLAEIAERYGSGWLRLSPFRGAVLPGIAQEHVAEVIELTRAAGWILDERDPLLRAVACPGAPACSCGLGATRAIARALLPLLSPTQTLHVSGCAKSCASDTPASITLVCDPEGARLATDATAFEAATQPPQELSAIREHCRELAQSSPARTTRA